MKRIFALFAVSCILISCGMLSGASKEEQKKIAASVAEAVSKSDLSIEVDTAFPVGAPIVKLDVPYDLKVSESCINGRLPYFGESHTALIANVDELGINFENAVPEKFSVDSSKSKEGEYGISFTALSGTMYWDVSVRVFSNGSADITCNCATRSTISYQGTVIFE